MLAGTKPYISACMQCCALRVHSGQVLADWLLGSCALRCTASCWREQNPTSRPVCNAAHFAYILAKSVLTGYWAAVPCVAPLHAGGNKTLHLGLYAMLRTSRTFWPSPC